MAFFFVTMSHPDEALWRLHIDAHMAYLYGLEGRSVLRASGALVDVSPKTGCILLTAPDRAHIDDVIAHDPFSINGVIGDLRVTEWDPFVGIFAAESSGAAPGAQAPAAQTSGPRTPRAKASGTQATGDA